MKKLIVIISVIFSAGIVISQNDVIKVEEILVIGKDSALITNKQHKMSDYIQFQPRSAGDVFAELPGTNSMKRGGFAIEPIVNGFKREQLNVTLDGGTQITHSCANRMDAMTSRISSREIDKIEIVRGPYNVRFGQTMGGIVNIISSQAHTSENFEFSGSAETGYELNGNGLNSGIELNATNKMFQFSLDGSYRKFDNYTAGGDSIREILSSFTAYDYAAKLGFTPNKNHQLSVSWRHSLAEDVLHAGLPMDALSDDGKLFAMDYAYRNHDAFLSGINFKTYGSLVDHLMTNEWRPNYKFAHTLAPVSSKTFGARTEFVLKPTDNVKLFTGIDGKYINKDGQRERETYINACTMMPLPVVTTFIDLTWQNSFSQDFGLFAEGQYSASDNMDVKLGIRADYIQSDAKDLAEDFVAMYGDSVHPGALTTANFFGTVSYRFGEHFNAEWSAGQGTRNPDLLELYINHFTVGQDMYEYLGNPTLKPETNRQTNLAAGLVYDKVSIYADIFYAHISDYISAKVDSSVSRKFLPCKDPKFTKRFVNISESMQYGADAGFKYDIFAGIYLGADVIYNIGEDLESGEDLPEIAPFTTRAAIGYKSKVLQAEIKIRNVSEQSRIAETSGETTSPGYTIYDVYVMYKPLKFLQIGAGVDNLTNELYYNHLSRPYQNQTENSMFYEAGRNVKFSIKVLF